MKKLPLYTMYFLMIFTTDNIFTGEADSTKRPTPLTIPTSHETFIASIPALQRVKSSSDLSPKTTQALLISRSRPSTPASPKHQFTQTPYKSPLAHQSRSMKSEDSE